MKSNAKISTKEAKQQAFKDMKDSKLRTHSLFNWYKEELKYQKENNI